MTADVGDVAPDASVSAIAIGTLYPPGPMMILPSASFAATLSATVVAVPAAGVGFDKPKPIEAMTPLSVALTVFALPATICLLTTACESVLPCAFGSSNALIEKPSAPTGASMTIVVVDGVAPGVG